MNKIAIITLAAMALLMASCGSLKKSEAVTPAVTPAVHTATAPLDGIIAAVGDWHTLQAGGTLAVKASSSFSSAVQVRMTRGRDIFISLRPMLGIEVGWLRITGDSIIAVDKVHKRYVAESASLLTAGLPVTVSDVQDVLLGRPFVMGHGTLGEDNRALVTAATQGNVTMLTPSETVMGHRYEFCFNKSLNLLSLNITRGASAYQVKYRDVKDTPAGRIAHAVSVNAPVGGKALDLSLTYKDMDWNGSAGTAKTIPAGYSRMNARDLLSLFAN